MQLLDFPAEVLLHNDRLLRFVFFRSLKPDPEHGQLITFELYLFRKADLVFFESEIGLSQLVTLLLSLSKLLTMACSQFSLLLSELGELSLTVGQIRFCLLQRALQSVFLTDFCLRLLVLIELAKFQGCHLDCEFVPGQLTFDPRLDRVLF